MSQQYWEREPSDDVHVLSLETDRGIQLEVTDRGAALVDHPDVAVSAEDQDALLRCVRPIPTWCNFDRCRKMNCTRSRRRDRGGLGTDSNGCPSISTVDLSGARQACMGGQP
jgi:hypothetical protein